MEYQNFRNHLSKILGVPIDSLEVCSTFYEIKKVKKMRSSCGKERSLILLFLWKKDC